MSRVQNPWIKGHRIILSTVRHHIKYCEDTWPGHQLEASENHTRFFASLLEGQESVTPWDCCINLAWQSFPSHHSSLIIFQIKELGINTQKAHKTALKFYAHSVLYAHKLTTIRRALEKSSCSHGLSFLTNQIMRHPMSYMQPLVLPSPFHYFWQEIEEDGLMQSTQPLCWPQNADDEIRSLINLINSC